MPHIRQINNKDFLNSARPGLISIEDPQTPENDIGKNFIQLLSDSISVFNGLVYFNKHESYSSFRTEPEHSRHDNQTRPDSFRAQRW
uniref:Uncharacterized protein n=1 Tax=Brassica oleracea TaxID=3712 RepID=A0A3P6DH34_BRAOL|nr:unnamed protein product [Brassica oleracea]